MLRRTSWRRVRQLAGKAMRAGFALAVVACGSKTAGSPPYPSGDPCVIAPAEQATIDTVDVVVESPTRIVQPLAPALAPGRVPLPMLYETLVRVDCTGAIVAELAVRWESRPGGKTGLTLADDARFWDGEPVTAAAVAAALADRAGRGARVESIVATGERTIDVGRPGGEPAAFADPALIITKAASTAEWPIGTGDYRILSLTRTSGGGIREVVGRALVAGVPPFVRYALPSGRDLRDGLDGGADLVVTRDPDALAYARRLEAFDVSPLPWDRAYALVTRRPTTPVAVPATVRQSLADEVARADARPSADPAELCADADSRYVRAPSIHQAAIAYDRSDPTAKALAERLAALAGTAGHEWLTTLLGVTARTRVHATGLLNVGIASSLASGTNAGYIIQLERRPTMSLERLGCPPAELARVAPWLPKGGAITPLIDTRPHLIRRRGVGPAQVDAFGGVRLVPATAR